MKKKQKRKIRNGHFRWGSLMFGLSDVYDKVFSCVKLSTVHIVEFEGFLEVIANILKHMVTLYRTCIPELNIIEVTKDVRLSLTSTKQIYSIQL